MFDIGIHAMSKLQNWLETSEAEGIYSLDIVKKGAFI